MIRLSPSGARWLDRSLAGDAVDDGAESTALRRRLLDAGMLHPVVQPTDCVVDPAFVVPVHDDPDGLTRVLAAIRADFPSAPVVVVDDASSDGDVIAAVAATFGAELARHDANRGPAAARNTGWRKALDTDPAIVVFLDADTEPESGAVALMLAHLDGDDTVSAVAPRVRARPGFGILDRYEVAESPLDLGSEPANVRPGSTVTYVPSAALAVRARALAELDGFDESLRVGEDVDFAWRLAGGGGTVRYEPRAAVRHRNRSSFRAFSEQRQSYGSAAAPLAEHHRCNVAPVELPPQTLAIWSGLILGRGRVRALASIGALVDAFVLGTKFSGRVDRPIATTARWSAFGHVHSARWLASATTRAWLPLAVLASLWSRRARHWLAVSLVVPAVVEWLRRRPAIDLITYVALRGLDDASYCSGVWIGAWRRRSVRALLPRIKRRRADRA